MLSCDIYRDTEIAGLKQIQKLLCEKHGFAGGFQGVNRLVARDALLVISAQIFPRREGKGIWVTVDTGTYDGNLRSVYHFDGQDYMFLSEESLGITNLEDWLEENYFR
jgi:hypothetical protein